MAAMTFPRTLTRGVLKGKRFGSQAAYTEALAAARNGKGPTDVAGIIDAYELLMQEGIGRRQATRVIEALARGGKK